VVLIYGIKERLNPIKAELSDVIHQTMSEVLGLPEDKRDSTEGLKIIVGS
jgi:hypothetical protein